MWNRDDENGEALFAACATPESFNEHLDAVNDSFFVACLDIGHAEMKGLKTSAPEMIHALGTRLAALHIHDNDKVHDLHQIPFSGQIDFAAAAKALRDIGYDGYLTLEADTYMESSGFDAETAFKGVCNLAAAAKRIDAMF